MITSEAWSALINLNRQADALIEKCQHEAEKSIPISREIPFYTSIEARFVNLPTEFASVPAPNSDALAGNNVKQVSYTNMGSRVYVREIGFQSYRVFEDADDNGRGIERSGDGQFPFNWHWNFLTSITQRKYSDKRVLASSAGRWRAGNHIAFREPLIIEPMETFLYECELLSSGMRVGFDSVSKAVIAMYLSGYREGI